jgi:hypothetical protein
MGRWSAAAAISLVAALAGSARGAEGERGLPRNGFWLEARLAAATVIAGGGNTALPVYQPGLTVGGRLAGRLNLGLGFAFFRLASNNTTATTFIFQPTAEVDLVKAADDRVMLYLKGGLPVGAVVQSAGRTLLVVGYDVGLGVRYAPHPMFAVGVEGGVLGVFSDPGANTGLGVQSIYGALTGSFFYGK